MPTRSEAPALDAAAPPVAHHGSKVRRIAEAVLLPLLVQVMLLGAWEAAVRWTGTTVFPSPLAVLRAFVELWNRGVLVAYARDSLLRVATGYLLALAAGVPVGTLLGWYPGAARAWNPVVQLLRPISPLAWIPVAIVLFGITNASTVFLIFLASFFPIVVATTNGVGSVPPILLRAGRNFGLTTPQLLWHVALPAALPQILVGLRIALGVAWVVVVAAEMIAIDSGLGYLVIDSRNAGKRYDLVVAAMILIGVIGLALDVLARRVERLRSVQWGFR